MSTEDRQTLLWDFLREFFNYEHYRVAIENARARVAEDPSYRARWQEIRETVTTRSLPPSEPLRLVNEGANQVLDENTDDEAYAWLDKMVANVERTDGEVDEY